MPSRRPASSPSRLAWAVGLAILAGHGTAHARPGRPAPQRVLDVLGGIESRLQSSAYRPVLRIDERRGVYEFDCSAMAGWVLGRAAPKARAAIGQVRPLARDFHRTIVAAATDRPRRGWLRLARVADALPGDVLAWRRPPWFKSRNTGHVAFVLERPVAVPGGVLVRIADATSIGHENDTRAEGQTGYGRGTLLVTTDPATGAGTGYGWFGAAALERGWIIPTEVVVGRVVR